MKLEEYLKQLENEPFKNELPAYIEAEDISENLIKIRGEWCAIPDCWGVIKKDGKYLYFRTDNDERGYICDREEREDEEGLVEYIKEDFDIDLAAAAKGPTTDSEMMRRFINEDYGYTKEEAAKIVDEFSKYEDIFEEFFAFQRYGRMSTYSGSVRLVIQGYTAEQLVKEYHMTEVEAYQMMIRLKNQPQQAIKELEQRKTEG